MNFWISLRLGTEGNLSISIVVIGSTLGLMEKDSAGVRPA